MTEIIEPDYVHYTRIKTIFADEARSLLAHIELRDKNISEPDEYERLLAGKMSSAGTVLFQAIDNDDLTYDYDEDAYDYNEIGQRGYIFSRIRFKAVDLYSWASKLKYNLPDELAELVSLSGSNEDVKYQVTEEPKSEKIVKNGKSGKSGPKKCTLSMAVEYVYLLLLERGQTDILKPRMRQAFMECFREMATEGNRNNDETLLELIKEVSKSKMGKYTIVTKERPNKKNPKKIDEKSGVYDATQVTRYLNSLRKNHPLTT